MRAAGCVSECPACPHRDYAEAQSLGQKERWLAQELRPWSDVLQPISGPKERWGYRRKSLLHARWRDSRWRFGMVKMHGREEEFISIPECPLHHSDVNALFARASEFAPAHFPLAFGLVSGNCFTLVVKSTRRTEWLHEMKEWEWPRDSSLFVNWNPVAGKRALDSRQMELVHGVALGEAGGLWHGPVAFRQQIPEMETAALCLAESFLQSANIPRAVDFYCGGGASLQRWRKLGWEAVGVELSKESLDCAELNAPGAHLFRGRVEDRLPQVDGFLSGESFVVYTNPPRSGHDERTLAWFENQKPKRIAYLSCHPRSLAGDLASLTSYKVAAIHPFDFFPQTGQVESLALLELNA